MIFKKIFRQFKKTFVRRYPWMAHFFYETISLNDAITALKYPFCANKTNDQLTIEAYEEGFKNLLGGDGSAFSFGSGRMALYAILEALNIGEGDEVLVPAFTCSVVITALMYRRIRPVYLDINIKDLNIDVDKMSSRISPKTKAVIIQHTFGIPCDVESLVGVARKYGFYVIEDCALAQGGRYNNKPLGTFGDASFFSTDRTKMLSTLWGGMAFTKDEQIAAKLKDIYQKAEILPRGKIFNMGLQVILSYFLLSPYVYFITRYFVSGGYRSGLFFAHNDDDRTFVRPKYYPCRLSGLQATLGLGQLKRLEDVLEKRKRSVKQYASELLARGINVEESLNAGTALRFSILLKDRDAFIRKWEKYFEVGKWFDSPAAGIYEDFDRIGYEKGSCPVAEFVHGHIVNFPTYPKSNTIKFFLMNIMASINPEDIASAA